MSARAPRIPEADAGERTADTSVIQFAPARKAAPRENPPAETVTGELVIVLRPLTEQGGRALRWAVDEHFAAREHLLQSRPDADADEKPVTRQAWEQALELTTRLVCACETIHCTLPLPILGPCGDGSIDLWWHAPNADFVANCAGQRGSYFGNHLLDLTRVEGHTLHPNTILSGLTSLGFTGPDPFFTERLIGG